METCSAYTNKKWDNSTQMSGGIERFVGAIAIASFMKPADGSATGLTTIEQFDLVAFMGDIAGYTIPLVIITYIAILAIRIVVVSLSLIWSRLSRMVGGKDYEEALGYAQRTPAYTGHKSHRVTRLSASRGRRSLTGPDEIVDGSSLILRTVKVKNAYTGEMQDSSSGIRPPPRGPEDKIAKELLKYCETKGLEEFSQFTERDIEVFLAKIKCFQKKKDRRTKLERFLNRHKAYLNSKLRKCCPANERSKLVLRYAKDRHMSTSKVQMSKLYRLYDKDPAMFLQKQKNS